MKENLSVDWNSLLMYRTLTKIESFPGNTHKDNGGQHTYIKGEDEQEGFYYSIRQTNRHNNWLGGSTASGKGIQKQ